MRLIQVQDQVQVQGRRRGAMLAALFLGVWTLSAGAQPPVSPDDVKGPLSWGAASNVTYLGDLYFAGQPDRAGLEAAQEAGVGIVINLRGATEIGWDEGADAKSLGLTYYNVPITGPRFEPESIARINALVAEHADQKILIHCGSSNRVGGWLATRLIDQGMSSADAIAVGRKAGITSQGIVDRVEAWAAQPQP